MSAWRWLRADTIFALHDIQIAEHGGLGGVRSTATVLSALARPEQLTAYADPPPDAAALAAAYAYGLARSQGFSDGNKRIAWLAARLFLVDNGYRLEFEPLEAVRIILATAAGTVSESDLAQWFRDRISA